MIKLDKETVRAAARGRWLEIIPAVTGIDAESLDGKHRPCPRCPGGGTDRFRAFDDFRESGGVICSQCHSERNGDGFATVQWANRCPFGEALQTVAKQLGIVSTNGRLARECANGNPTRNGIAPSTLDLETLERVCAAKQMPVPSALAFGARTTRDEKKRRLIEFPQYDEILNECGQFRIWSFPKNGKSGDLERKGMNVKGGRAGLFLPHDVSGNPWRPTPGETCLMVEGVKDSAVLHSLGYPTIGLPTSSMNKQFAPLFKAVNMIIVPDLDAAGQKGAIQTASRLTDLAASVKIVRLPGEIRKSTGIDCRDVLAGPDGEALLRQAIDGAQEWMPTKTEANSDDEFAGLMEPEKEKAGEADPSVVASSFLANNYWRDGLSRLRFWRGTFYCWRRGRYIDKADGELRAEVVNFFTQDYLYVRGRHVSDVLEHLRATTLLPGSVEPPTWLAEFPTEFKEDECLATKSGIVHLPSLITNSSPSILSATPAYFTLNATDFDLDPGAPQPAAWLWFLKALWGDDQQSIDTLQELFGYLLTSDTRQEKIFLMIGPKRSGKGTIARVLTAIIGKDNIAAPTLAGLSTNFGLWPLIGKSLAIISDARLSGRADQVAVVERLLSISGEDSITIDRKNLPPVTCRLPTRFLILTNELPRLTDASGAIVSRLVVLRTTRSFYGHEDHHLTDKLLEERQGILCWAIVGWYRLRERGRFIQPESSWESLGEMDDLASPVAAFVRHCCEVGSGKSVPMADLYAAWKQWCEQEGRKKSTGSAQTFGRDLTAAIAGIRRKRPNEDGERIRVYEGIELTEEARLRLDRARDEEQLDKSRRRH